MNPRPLRSPLAQARGGGILAWDIQHPAPYDSEDEGEDDLMVNEVIRPFAIPAKIIVPKSVAQEKVDALIDSGLHVA